MNKIIKIIITILIIIESIFMYLTYKSFINKPSNINEVTVKSTEGVPINNNSFAIMLENTDGTFSPSTDRTQWPDTNTYIYYSTDCYDGDGKISSNAIGTFNAPTKKFTLSTDTSSYCNIKFAKKTTSLGKLLTSTNLETEETRQQNRPNDTLRRFQGTKDQVTNNYICFGAQTCQNEDDYMYRIIGVVAQDDEITGEKSGMLKVIKQTPDDALEWTPNPVYNPARSWKTSVIYMRLNGIYIGGDSNYSSDFFLTNDTLVPDIKIGTKSWREMIEIINWRYGKIDYSGVNQAGRGVLSVEKSWTDTVSAKIGLMYVSDYCLAYDNTTNWYEKKDKTNWIHIENINYYYYDEWTMSRESDIAAVAIYNAGGIGTGGGGLGNRHWVRPVFYLSTSIQLKGSGTKTDPYIIVSA